MPRTPRAYAEYLLAICAGTAGNGSIVRVDPNTGTQTLYTSGGNLTNLDGGSVDVTHGCR